MPTVTADNTTIARQTRISSMCAELEIAWDNSEKADLKAWAKLAGGDFTRAITRRVTNMAGVIGWVAGTTYSEMQNAYCAYRDSRLIAHVKVRSNTLTCSAKDLALASKDTTVSLVTALKNHPADVGPQLLTTVLTSLLVSGGPDGNGGLPDVDLKAGIGFHRSPLTHSILIGAALETGLMSLVRLVHLVHAQLPPHHDPLWDVLEHQSTALLNAANRGASLGLAYHLLVDGLAQPAPYHGRPISLPIEGHQAMFVANGMAEAIDARHKPSSRITKEIMLRDNPTYTGGG